MSLLVHLPGPSRAAPCICPQTVSFWPHVRCDLALPQSVSLRVCTVTSCGPPAVEQSAAV